MSYPRFYWTRELSDLLVLAVVVLFYVPNLVVGMFLWSGLSSLTECLEGLGAKETKQKWGNVSKSLQDLVERNLVNCNCTYKPYLSFMNLKSRTTIISARDLSFKLTTRKHVETRPDWLYLGQELLSGPMRCGLLYFSSCSTSWSRAQAIVLSALFKIML